MLQALLPLAVGLGSAYGQKKIQDKREAAVEVVFKLMQGEEPTEDDRHVLASLNREDLDQVAKTADIFSIITKRETGTPVSTKIRSLIPGLSQNATMEQVKGLVGEEGMRSLLNIIPPVSPTEQRIREEKKQEKKQQGILGDIMQIEAGKYSGGGPFSEEEKSVLPQLNAGNLIEMGLQPKNVFGYLEQAQKIQKPTQPKSSLYKEFADFRQGQPDWQGTIFDYIKTKKVAEKGDIDQLATDFARRDRRVEFGEISLTEAAQEYKATLQALKGEIPASTKKPSWKDYQ